MTEHDSNEDVELDKLLAELEKDSSEESKIIPKTELKPEDKAKYHNSTEAKSYEIADDLDFEKATEDDYF